MVGNNYTAEELKNAEVIAKKLEAVPEEKRMIIIMMTNSFIAGMETQEHMDKKTA